MKPTTQRYTTGQSNKSTSEIIKLKLTILLHVAGLPAERTERKPGSPGHVKALVLLQPDPICIAVLAVMVAYAGDRLHQRRWLMRAKRYVHGGPQPMRLQGCVQRDIRIPEMPVVFVRRALQRTVNCSFRRAMQKSGYSIIKIGQCKVKWGFDTMGVDY